MTLLFAGIFIPNSASATDLYPKLVSTNARNCADQWVQYKGSLYCLGSDEESDFLLRFDGKEFEVVLRKLPDSCFTPNPVGVYKNKLLLLGYCDSGNGGMRGSLFTWNGFSSANLSTTFPELSQESPWGAKNCNETIFFVGKNSSIWEIASNLTKIASASDLGSLACDGDSALYSVEGRLFSTDSSAPLFPQERGVLYLEFQVESGGKVFYRGGLAPDYQNSLWSYDLVSHSFDQVSNFYTSFLTEVNGELFSSGQDTKLGMELFSFTDSGPRLAADIVKGKEGSNPSVLIDFKGDLYFTTKDGLFWRLTNGDLYTIVDATKLTGGNQSSRVSRTFVLNDQLFFQTSTPTSGGPKEYLWVYRNSAQTLAGLNDSAILKFDSIIYLNITTNANKFARAAFSGPCRAQMVNVTNTDHGKTVTTKVLKVTAGRTAGTCTINLTSPTTGKYLDLRKVVQIKVSKTGK